MMRITPGHWPAQAYTVQMQETRKEGNPKVMDQRSMWHFGHKWFDKTLGNITCFWPDTDD